MPPASATAVGAASPALSYQDAEYAADYALFEQPGMFLFSRGHAGVARRSSMGDDDEAIEASGDAATTVSPSRALRPLFLLYTVIAIDQ